MQIKFNNEGKSKFPYNTICNEPINLMVPIKMYPYKFVVPTMGNYKGKEFPSEHLI